MTLDELRAATERIGANLLEVELDPNRRLLEDSELDGETATRWAAASATLAQLWQWHGQLQQLVERAGHARGAKREELLDGLSIEVTTRAVPLEERNLLGGAETTVRCTPADLANRMAQAFDEARTAVVEIGQRWDVLLPRLRDARTALEHATELGDTTPELRRLQELEDRAARDPLATNLDDVAALEARITELRTQQAERASLRANLDERLEAARGLIAELEAAHREATAAYEEARVKVLDTALPQPNAVPDELAAEIDAVAELARAGAWREAADALARFSARATRMVENARRVAAASRAPIQQRDELRGRLDAYQVKAQRLGMLEDPTMADLFDRAQQALYEAPTDLAGAADLVRRYQEALSP